MAGKVSAILIPFYTESGIRNGPISMKNAAMPCGMKQGISDALSKGLSRFVLAWIISQSVRESSMQKRKYIID